MVDFYWVRHGPTHAKTLVGHTDLPADLSDKAQLSQLSTALPRDADIYSSDLVRTIQTAEAIAKSRTILAPRAALREMHFGTWENKSFAEVAAKDPDLSRQFWENPGDVAPPKGESWNVFSNRVHDAIHDILAETKSENLVIVAHFGVILAALQLATGIPAKSVFSFKVDNLSVSKFKFDLKSQAWTVSSVNQSY